MKKFGILKLFSIVTLAAAGALALVNVSSKSNQKVESASAVSAGQKVFLNPGVWNTDSAWFASYFFNNDKTGGDTWVRMTADGSYYYAEVPSGFDSVIFVRMNKASDALDWNNKWNQSYDLLLPSNNLYTISGWGGDKSPGDWSNRSGRYVVGSFGGHSWDFEGAVYMLEDNGEFQITASLARGDSFKIVYYDGSYFHNDSYVGYSTVRTGCGAYNCFGGDNDDNITCNAGGSYHFYFKQNGYDEGSKSISLETNGYSAEQFAYKLMSFGSANPGVDGDHSCGNSNKFPAMRTIYLGLGSDQSVFQGYVSSGVTTFREGYERYVAWAAALGENPWSSGSSGLRQVLNAQNKQISLVFVISLVSIIGVTSIGGYFFYKKRKENI